MSEIDVRKALNTHFQTLVTTSIDTVDENQSFKPTDPSRPYEELHLLINDPESAGMGINSGVWRTGIFSVLLYYPPGSGAKPAAQRAKEIADHFTRGTTLTSGSVTVKLTKPAKVKTSRREADRYLVPVHIPYLAFDA